MTSVQLCIGNEYIALCVCFIILIVLTVHLWVDSEIVYRSASLYFYSYICCAFKKIICVGCFMCVSGENASLH